MAMDEEKKKPNIGIQILEDLSRLLTGILIGSLLIIGLIYYSNWKYEREKELNPPEVPSQEMLKLIAGDEMIDLVDGTYIIRVKPDRNFPYTIYNIKNASEGKPFKVYCGNQVATSGDDSCYCTLNGEKIANVEDLAEKDIALEKRLRLEKLITPEELAIYDRYLELERTKGNEEAQRILGEELGLSDTDAFWKVHNIFYIDLGHHEPLSPELFRLNMLEWALDYPSEQNWRDFYDAGNAVQFMYFASDYHLHLNDQEAINQLIAEAKNQLGQMSEDYPNQLSENIPGIVDLIEETFATYPENKSFFEDNSGNLDHLETALEMPGSYEDWTRVKTAIAAAGIATEKPAA